MRNSWFKMKRIVEIFAVAGTAIPISLFLLAAFWGEFPDGLLEIMVYIWPSSIFVTLGPGGIVGWIGAVIINVILYSFIGVLIKYSWILISKWRKAETS